MRPVDVRMRGESARALSLAAGAAAALCGLPCVSMAQEGLPGVDDPSGLIESIVEEASGAGEVAGPGVAVEAPAARPELRVTSSDLVSLSVVGGEIGQILQLLSLQSGRNIVASSAVTGTVTAELTDLPFLDALDALLSINGQRWVQRGTVIYVFGGDEYERLEEGRRKVSTRVVRLNYLSASDAATLIDSLKSEVGKIQNLAATATYASSIDDSNPTGADSYALDASLVLTDYAENLDQMVAVLNQLDTKPVQVLVEATVLQATLNESNAFGVDISAIADMNFSDFAGEDGGGVLGTVGGLLTGRGQDVSGAEVPAGGSDGNGFASSSTPGNTGGPGTFKVGVVAGDLAVFLRALDQVTDVTVVSNPKVMTLNRQPARVLVGTRVGFVTTEVSDNASTQTVNFLDTGVELALRPFVTQDELIRLELRPSVSSAQLRDVSLADGSVVTIPDENTSELTANVMVRDGQTVVLGGLFRETTTATRRQVPILGNIPLVGAAFRGHDDSVERTETIFLIRPSVVNDVALDEQGRRAEEYVRAAVVGARKGLLPFSRDRRVSQLLIEARRAAEAGDRKKALFHVNRALAIAPTSRDAIKLRSDITADPTWYPTRSMLSDIYQGELDSLRFPDDTYRPGEGERVPSLLDPSLSDANEPLSSATGVGGMEVIEIEVGPEGAGAEVGYVSEGRLEGPLSAGSGGGSGEVAAGGGVGGAGRSVAGAGEAVSPSVVESAVFPLDPSEFVAIDPSVLSGASAAKAQAGGTPTASELEAALRALLAEVGAEGLLGDE